MTDDSKAEDSQPAPANSRTSDSIEGPEPRSAPSWSLRLIDAGVIFTLATAFFFVAGYARLEGKFAHFYVPRLVQEMSTTDVLINALSSVMFIIATALVAMVGVLILAFLKALAERREFKGWFWTSFRPSEPGSVWYYLTLVLFAFMYFFPLTITYAAKDGAKAGARDESGAPVVRIYDTVGAEIEKLAYLTPTDSDHVFFRPGCGDGPPITIRLSRERIGRIETTGEVAETLCHVESTDVAVSDR